MSAENWLWLALFVAVWLPFAWLIQAALGGFRRRARRPAARPWREAPAMRLLWLWITDLVFVILALLATHGGWGWILLALAAAIAADLLDRRLLADRKSGDRPS